MTFDEVEGAYFRLKKGIPSIWSTFRVCSKDDNSGDEPIYLVESPIPCYDFDRIKLHFFRSGKSSADSLYFSQREEILYFIEFKNSRFHNFFESIPKKAYDSLCVHQCVCDQESIPLTHNVFMVVMSDEKNQMSNPTSIMMRNSGYFSSTSLMDELSNVLRNGFDAFSKGSAFEGCFLDFAVVLSSRFDDYIEHIR